MPEFAEDGKFNNDRYLQLIRRAGMTRRCSVTPCARTWCASN
jgi:hypothetical protein